MTSFRQIYDFILLVSDPGFNWTAEDYIIALAMLSLLIGLIVLIKITAKKPKLQTVLIIAAVLLMLLIWVDLGVGIFNFPWSGD
jgi:hypothetical protein